MKRNMRRAILVPLVLLLLGSTPTVPRLSDAAPSADALIARFLEALQNKDAVALRRLRVAEEESLKIPPRGAGDRGNPWRKGREETCRYFWSEINAKSLYTEETLLGIWGGHTYQVKGVAYEKGT